MSSRASRIANRLASVAVSANCQRGSPKRRASSPPTQIASSLGSINVIPRRALLRDRPHGRLRRVAGHRARVAEAEVDVLVAVDVAEPRTCGLRCEDGEAAGPADHPRHRAPRRAASPRPDAASSRERGCSRSKRSSSLGSSSAALTGLVNHLQTGVGNLCSSCSPPSRWTRLRAAARPRPDADQRDHAQKRPPARLRFSLRGCTPPGARPLRHGPRARGRSRGSPRWPPGSAGGSGSRAGSRTASGASPVRICGRGARAGRAAGRPRAAPWCTDAAGRGRPPRRGPPRRSGPGT